MLTHIALDFSSPDTSSTQEHDAADFDNLIQTLTETPCVLLVSGESFESSSLSAQIASLSQAERSRLQLLIQKLPILPLHSWDGKFDGKLPPFEHYREHILAVTKRTYNERFNCSSALTSVTLQNSPKTEIGMWKAIRSTKIHRRFRTLADADIEPKTSSETIWNERIAPAITGIKWQTVTVIDRYVFGNQTDVTKSKGGHYEREFPDFRALDFLLKQLDGRLAAKTKLRIVFEADFCAAKHDLNQDLPGFLVEIAKRVAEFSKQYTSIFEIQLYAFRHKTMVEEYHDRFLYLNTGSSLLYSFEFGKGFAVFQKEECDARSSFHFQSFINNTSCKRYQHLCALVARSETRFRGKYGNVELYLNTDLARNKRYS